MNIESTQIISKKSRFEQDDDEADDAPRLLRRPNAENNKKAKCHDIDLSEDEEKSCDIDLTKEESTESTFDLPMTTNTSHHADTNHALGM